MKLNVYSIFDSKVQAFLPPFYMRTDGEARRATVSASMDPSQNFHVHAADYTLFCLGEFDDESGQITMLTAMRNIGNLRVLRGAEEISVHQAMKEMPNVREEG